MDEIMKYRTQVVWLFASAWVFILGGVVSSLHLYELFIYFILAALATNAWMNHVDKAFRQLVWGICSNVALVGALYVFNMESSELIALITLAAQVFVYFATVFGED